MRSWLCLALASPAAAATGSHHSTQEPAGKVSSSTLMTCVQACPQHHVQDGSATAAGIPFRPRRCRFCYIVLLLRVFLPLFSLSLAGSITVTQQHSTARISLGRKLDCMRQPSCCWHLKAHTIRHVNAPHEKLVFAGSMAPSRAAPFCTSPGPSCRFHCWAPADTAQRIHQCQQHQLQPKPMHRQHYHSCSAHQHRTQKLQRRPVQATPASCWLVKRRTALTTPRCAAFRHAVLRTLR
jgi:hypothetical protein